MTQEQIDQLIRENEMYEDALNQIAKAPYIEAIPENVSVIALQKKAMQLTAHKVLQGKLERFFNLHPDSVKHLKQHKPYTVNDGGVGK